MSARSPTPGGEGRRERYLKAARRSPVARANWMSVKTKVSARRHSAATHLELHRQGRRTAISPARSPVRSVAVRSGKASGRLAMNAHGRGVKDRFVATTGCSDASPGPTMQWTRVCAAPVVATVKQQGPDDLGSSGPCAPRWNLRDDATERSRSRRRWRSR